jgi:LPXTG-motif cell wall-anchored protein
MASASITAAGAIINGRLLALNAAVTLDTISIVNDAFVATAIPEPEPELETNLEVDAETEKSTPRGYYPRTSTEVGGVIPNTGTNGWFFAAMVGLGISLAGVLALPKLRRHG